MPYESNRRSGVGAAQQMIQASGKTREMVSTELGIHKTSMSDMINKGHSPSISRLADIAQVCGYDLRLVGHGEVIHVKPNPKE